ncbi:hypothetical protein CLOSCI_02814 [[Clostridium] scindens ATCC 35704]|nr:hypothetical protein CLOSCI_02814 [[Clostridium] scindens ATCC 35704]
MFVNEEVELLTNLHYFNVISEKETGPPKNGSRFPLYEEQFGFFLRFFPSPISFLVWRYILIRHFLSHLSGR